MQRAPYLLLALFLGSCALPEQNEGRNVPVGHLVVVQGQPIEYWIPGSYRPGYFGTRKEIDFSDPNAVGKLNGIALSSKSIGIYFTGVRGEFRDWDNTLWVSAVLVLDEGAAREDRVALVKRIFSVEYALPNGGKVQRLGEIFAKKVGAHEVVVVCSTEQKRVRELPLADGRSVALLHPFRKYCVFLSDRLMVCVEVEFENQKKMDEKSKSEGYQAAEYVIEHLLLYKK